MGHHPRVLPGHGEPLFGSRVMIFAHDELILEMPEERRTRLRCAVEVMVAAMKSMS